MRDGVFPVSGGLGICGIIFGMGVMYVCSNVYMKPLQYPIFIYVRARNLETACRQLEFERRNFFTHRMRVHRHVG